MIFFFFKQKTAYEMRISDWSSDVCSSDLAEHIVEKASAIAPTGVDPHPDDPSIWYFPNSIATFNDSLSPNGRGEFLIPEGPRAYARFIPGGWTDRKSVV